MSQGTGTGFRSSARAYISAWRSPQNLSKKASLTSLASGLDYAAGIIVQAIINPLLVRGLGTYLYGAWRVLYQFNGYLWAASGRSAQALTWVIAKGQHSLTDDERRRYAGSAVVVWCIFLPFLALGGGLLSWVAPHFLKTPLPYVWGVRVAGLLLTADAIALTLLTIPRSTLQGSNLGYKRMGLSALLILAGGGFMAIAVYLHAGIGGVALANLADTVVTGALFYKVARTFVPWFGFERPTKEDIRWMLRLSGWFTIWKIVFELMTGGDVVVLGVFASVQLVTVYSLTGLVAWTLVPLIAIVFEGSSPGLGGIFGRGDMEKAIQIRNEIMAMTWLITTVLGGSLLLWDRSFVGLWVGRQFYAGTTPLLLILVMVMQFVFIGNDGRIMDLTLKVRAKVLCGAASAMLSIALAIVFMKSFDDPIVGMCVGFIVGRLALTVGYPWLVGRILGHPIMAQLRATPRPLLTTALLFGATLRLGELLTITSWITLLFLGSLTAVGLGVTAGFIGLSKGQRKAMMDRARIALAGRGGKQPTSPAKDDGDRG